MAPLQHYLDIIKSFFLVVLEGGSIPMECALPKIHKDLINLCAPPVAVVICIIFSFLARRKRRCPQKCHGRPGIAIPMNALDMRHIRVGYIIAFGAITHSIVGIVRTEEAPFANEAFPKWFNNLLKIVGVFIYGTMWYPIFAAVSAESIAGYIIGFLYTLGHLTLVTYNEAACANKIVKPQQIAETFFDKLPIYAFMCIMCGYFIVQSIQKCRGKRLPSDVAREEENKVMAQYVRDLFKYKNPVGNLKEKLESLHMIGKTGFVFPPRFICSMMVAALVLYSIIVSIFSVSVPIFRAIMKFRTLLLDQEVREKERSHYEAFQNLLHGNSSIIQKKEDIIIVIGYFCLVLKICFILSITLAIIACIVHFLFLIRNYRRDVLLAYKGQYPYIRHPSTISPYSAILGFSRFTGYNVAYLVWGFIVQFALFFLVITVVAVAVFVPLCNGFGQFWLSILESSGPIIVMTVCILLIQMLVTRFVFTRAGSIIAINNRQVFFVWTYYIFFYDIYLGLLSCLLRIAKSIGVGILFVGRIDVPILSRLFEMLDPGYSVYSEFVLTEVAHNNPVMRTFLNILVEDGKLWKETRERESIHVYTDDTLEDVKVFENAIEMSSIHPGLRSRQVQFQWQLLYSLHNNPGLRSLRKHQMDKFKELIARKQRSDHAGDETTRL